MRVQPFRLTGPIAIVACCFAFASWSLPSRADVVIHETETFSGSHDKLLFIEAYNATHVRSDTYHPEDIIPAASTIDNLATHQYADVDWRSRTSIVQPISNSSPYMARVTATNQYRTILGFRARLYIDQYDIKTVHGMPDTKETQYVWATDALPDYPDWITKEERTKIRGAVLETTTEGALINSHTVATSVAVEPVSPTTYTPPKKIPLRAQAGLLYQLQTEPFGVERLPEVIASPGELAPKDRQPGGPP